MVVFGEKCLTLQKFALRIKIMFSRIIIKDRMTGSRLQITLFVRDFCYARQLE